MFTLRFDLRAPDHGAPAADLYAAAVDMAVWAEEHGALSVVVSEHHASPDGYLPSPVVVASAMAARTTRLPIQVVALLAPLHHPVRLAEDLAVLDLLSRGRVSYVLGLGYRQEEYDLYGIDRADRGPRLEAAVELMRRAWSGEPVDTPAGPVRITPAPYTPGGPTLLLGGGTPAAVRRAARLGLGMLTERSAGLTERYLEECARAGTEPGLFIEVPEDEITAAFVAEDVDAAWEELAPYLLYDAGIYARWNREAGKPLPASMTGATTVEELRAPGSPYRVFTPGEAVAQIRSRGFLSLHPLCGGLPPALAWRSLELLAGEVLPVVTA